jgi:hypothetical protein
MSGLTVPSKAGAAVLRQFGFTTRAAVCVANERMVGGRSWSGRRPIT